MNLTEILNTYNRLNYPILTDGRINIFGIRSSNEITDAWDDMIGLFWYKDGVVNFHSFDGTTDAGKFYAANPIDGKRTAIMVPGFYEDVYQIGLHQGKYEGLRQVKPIAFYQDVNKDYIIDTDSEIKWQTIGANIHSTREGLDAWRVGKFSAACQVIKAWNDFQTFMNICKSTNQGFFSYALLEAEKVS